MERFIAVDNVCAWPNLTLMPDGAIVATIFNQPTHLRWPGDVECWASTDEGHTWDEPRFVFANALHETLESAFRNHQCSYMDMFADGNDIHLFVPRRWRQILHLRFKESDTAEAKRA